MRTAHAKKTNLVIGRKSYTPEAKAKESSKKLFKKNLLK